MLTANRFTTVVTTETRDRLERAATNSLTIARGDRHRGAVVAVQLALAELNRNYLLPAEVDGYFGSRTANAVEQFQRDYGLIADSVIGRQTMMQLDALYSSDVVRSPRGISIHVGVDRVDRTHYGSEMTLPSCENDAKAMRDIATQLGYQTNMFVNESATTSSFATSIRSAASILCAGDALFLTFSGHGSQLTDDTGAESDLRDETLCFYDRMLVDDELWSLLSLLREGVRVHLVFDSCHSGTAFKELRFDSADVVEEQKSLHLSNLLSARPTTKSLVLLETGFAMTELDTSPVPIKTSSLASALEGNAPELVDRPDDLDHAPSKEIGQLFADLYAGLSFGKPKFVDNSQIYLKNKPLYDSVRAAVGHRETEPLACTVSALSACMDAQTTPAGSPLSLFTFNLSRTWASGNFPGSYRQFHSEVNKIARPDATPQINTDGALGHIARIHERPFAF